MKRVILLFAFLLIGISSYAKIQQQIDFDTTMINKFSDEPSWLYTGSFYFEQLPKPLQSTKINFTLTALNDDDLYSNENDWKIKIVYYDNKVEVLGDKSLAWPGPHKKGDVFSGTFEVIPLRSGSCVISLSSGTFEPEIDYQREPSIHWCFDEDGNLQYLSQYNIKLNRCDPAVCFFFNEDSVIIKQHQQIRDREIFEYEIVIKPTPSIGDTSTVRFLLNSNYDILAGCDITLETRGFSLLNKPEKPDFNVSKDQKLEIPLIVIPKAIKSGHQISLTFSNFSSLEKSGSKRQVMWCRLIFDDNGKLKYISNEGLRRMPADKYPQSYRSMNSIRDVNRIELKANE